MKAIHFGAGNIGRGFIGQILQNSHFDITFVDANQSIIEQINKNNGYYIEYLDDHGSRFFIGNSKAINIVMERDNLENTLSETDLITTSVGVNNLKHIASVIKRGLLKRSKCNKKINILVNENAINAGNLLKKEIQNISIETEWAEINKIAFFVNTSIDRQSLTKVVNDEIIALVEPYFEWVINASELAPDTPYQLENVKLVSDLTPYIERKLFIVNAEHAAFAYVGALFGYKTVQEAISDSRINSLVHEFLEENCAYFIAKYEMHKNELETFIDKTIKRHANPILSDPVERVGRDPIRKLNELDRLVSPVLNLYKLGFKIDAGIKIITSAYLYNNCNDLESIKLQENISKIGIENTIKKISNLPEELIHRISKVYQEIKNDRQFIFK
ncbi:hypothetical protein A4G18_04155 [Pasteurellaceae bacterium Pebbles2]|nr:hypothetical protein [Pasteurellaceae bacterium Pebbles2]